MKLPYLPDGFNSVASVFNKIMGKIVSVFSNPIVNDIRIAAVEATRTIVMIDKMVVKIRIIVPMFRVIKEPIGEVKRRKPDDNHGSIRIKIIPARSEEHTSELQS